MVRTRRIGVAAALIASVLLAGTAATAAAAGGKSFTATFCYSANYNGVTPALVVHVTWSGYRVDGVSLGEGDGTGAGFGVVDPISPAARSGSDTVGILADDTSPFGGADIRLGSHVWQSATQDAPNGSWANLPAC